MLSQDDWLLAVMLLLMLTRLHIAASAKSCYLGLSMIVHNDAAVLRRCLVSVEPLIDCWSISDAGSTDNTTDIILEELAAIPGELQHDEWADPVYGRTTVLQRLKSKYTIFLQADDELVYPIGYQLPELSGDSYCRHSRGLVDSTRAAFIRSDVTREFIYKFEPVLQRVSEEMPVFIRDIHIRTHTDHDGFNDDTTASIALLESEVATQPNNTHYAFHLSRLHMQLKANATHHAAAQRALSHFLSLRDTSAENRYLAQVWLADLKLAETPHYHSVKKMYLAAHELAPQRPDAIFALARAAAERGQWGDVLGYIRAVRNMTLLVEPPLLYQPSILTWQADVVHASFASHLGDFTTAFELQQKLLVSANVPPRQQFNLMEQVARTQTRVDARLRTDVHLKPSCFSAHGEQFHVYWINMDRSAERREKMRDMLSTLNVTHTRITAIDKRDLHATSMINCFRPPLTPADIATTSSHLKAAYAAYQDRRSSALILEDDVVVLRMPTSALLDCAPDDWEILKLYMHGPRGHRLYIVRPAAWVIQGHPDQLWSAAAYIINRTGMEKALKTFLPGLFSPRPGHFIVPVDARRATFTCHPDAIIFDACRTYVSTDIFFYEDGETSGMRPSQMWKMHQGKTSELVQNLARQTGLL